MDSDGERYPESLVIIPLSDIDQRDETFRITTRKDVDDLKASIRRMGLLAAPLIIDRPDGRTIVSGFRRIAACRRLGWKHIRARVLHSEYDPFECARKAVGENSTQRTLNLIETSRALGLLGRHAPAGEVPPEDLAALGLPCHPDVVDRVKSLEHLPSAVQEGILEGSISFSMACELGELEKGLAIRFAELFRRLKISLNKQRDILCLVLEIARREDIPGWYVLEEPALANLLGAEGVDRRQKAHQLRQLLRQRRYPALIAAEANFNRLRQRLKLGKNLHLTPPKDFEGTDFNLTLTFENLKDLIRLKERLGSLVEHPDLKTILEEKGSWFGLQRRPDGGGGSAGG